MATYAIGDVHSCFHELKALLNKIAFNASVDTLYFTGDLIGRGPYAEETLDLILDLSNKGVAFSVMGNHELFYLAVFLGIFQDKKKAAISSLLNSKRKNEFYNFIVNRPFLILNKELNFLISHAGIYPKWDLKKAQERASELHNFFTLDKSHLKLIIRNNYGDDVFYDKNNDSDLNRLKFSLNAFTRMRFCDDNCVLNYGYSSNTIDEVRPLGLYPWFEKSQDLSTKNFTQIFGHWAALQGQCNIDNIKALDTGCLWGGKLTAIDLATKELISVPSDGHLEVH